tara:strand:+ start:49 stop:1872 length:1824 start_codon:yes stop_codon:yes gene_type:complete
MSKNNNVNQNAIQIVFPSDMELRKVKKKKKKKSPNESKKKELIDELKELLQDYDQEIEVAKEKNIKLPSELGELPKDIKELKSTKQLELVTDEIKNKILKIQQFIKGDSVANRSNQLFGVAPRIGMGTGVFPQQAPIPQIQQPQVIPQFVPQFIPQQPQVIPQPVRPAIDVGSKLDALEAEILKNLDPNDPNTKDIIARINERKKQQQSRPLPPTPAPSPSSAPLPLPAPPPVSPSVSPAPVSPAKSPILPEDLNLETTTGERVEALGFSGKRVIVSSPKPKNNISWMDNINEPFNRYVDNLKFDAQQLRPGEFHIPLEQNNQLNKMRQDILNSYNSWLGDLTPEQRDYVDKNPLLRTANSTIFTSVSISPRDLLFTIYERQRIPNLKVTAGDTHPEIEDMLKKSPEKVSASAKALEAKMKEQITNWETETKFLSKMENENEYFNRLTQNEILTLRQGYDTKYLDFNDAHNKLPPLDKAFILSTWEQLILTRDKLQSVLNDRYEKLQEFKERDPTAAKKQELDAEQDVKVKPLPLPEERTVIGTSGTKSNKDLIVLIEYVDGKRKNWTMDIQSSFNKLFPNITERLPAGPAKRPIVRKLVQKYQSEN